MLFRCAFTIGSDTRYLAPLRQWVAAVSKIVGTKRFPRRAIMVCSLALIEAVDNAIFHAHDRKADMPIGVSLEVGAGTIVMEVKDRGKGLDHPSVAAPDSMSDHGRGLFLIRETMSSVRSSCKDGWHKMRMVYDI